MCAGVGWFRNVPEDSGRFGRVPACVDVGSGGMVRFRRVLVCAGVGSGGRVRIWRIPMRFVAL